MTQSRTAPPSDAAATAAAVSDAAAQWGEAWERLASSMTRLMQLQPRLEAPKRFDPMVVFEAVTDMTLGLVKQPSKLVELQMKAWQDFAQAWTAPMLSGDAAPAAPVLARTDRRFKDGEWEENPYYRGFRDNYLLVSRQLRTLVDESGEEDPSKRAIVGFLVEQYLNALAPTNFAFSNPVVMRRTVETGGANLVCFTTGRGSAYGCIPSPSIKLATNSALYERQADDIDVNCGEMLDRDIPAADMGRRIFDEMLRVASGGVTKSEAFGYGQDEFAPWIIGATM